MIKSQSKGLYKDISMLVSGTAIAQLIPILLQPLLRRFYQPEDFGAYAVYLSLTGILVVIASFKYEFAIVLPEKDKQAANLVAISIMINVIFSLILLTTILVFRDPILSLIRLPQKYSIYLFLLPAGVFLNSFYQSINYWLIRKKRFFHASMNKFIRRGTEGLGQAGFILTRNSSGLVIGDIFGHLGNILSGTIQILRSGYRFKYVSISKLRYVAVKYNEYPKYNVLPGFMSACSYLLPAIFINRFYSTGYTGFFDLSKLMLSIPLALIATAISNVLLQRISEKYRRGQSVLADLFKVFKIVLPVALLEVIVIRAAGIQIFSIFFGNDWRFSGEISRFLVWSFAFNFLIASFTSIFISMNRIKIMSAWQLLYFLAIFSLIKFRNLPFENFLKTYVIIEICCYFVISIIMIYIIVKYENRLRQLKKTRG